MNKRDNPFMVVYVECLFVCLFLFVCFCFFFTSKPAWTFTTSKTIIIHDRLEVIYHLVLTWNALLGYLSNCLEIPIVIQYAHLELFGIGSSPHFFREKKWVGRTVLMETMDETRKP
jgi:hypothetical protein